LPTTADARKRHGIHYTPPELARFLARRAVRALTRAPSDRVRVLDPACGHGELLVAAHAELRRAGYHDVELVGWDTDPAARDASRDRLASLGSPSTVERRDFLAEQAGGVAQAVDMVVTNPPYVRTQVLGGAEAAVLARRFGLRGRVDLAHAFVAAAHAVLADGATLALLCSNRFLTTRAGANVRELLRDRFAVEEVVDLGDSKPFGAAVLPAVVIAVRSRSGGGAARFVSVYADPACARDAGASPGCVADLYAAAEGVADGCVVRGGAHFAVTVGRLRMGEAGDRTWSLSSGRNDRWTADVGRGTWATFGELGRIRVGIKTTADQVFVRDDWDRMAEADRPEEQLLLPLLTHRDVAAWRTPAAPATRVLYPYDLAGHERRVLDLADYPRALAYLDRHRERLEARGYLIAAGRRWYEIWVPQRPAAWRGPKVVFPDISVEPRFAIDSSGAVVNGDCYWMAVEEFAHEDLAHLLVAVANSPLAVRFYDILCGNRLYAGRRRWMTQYVARLPVPDPDTAVARRIVERSRELCATPRVAPVELVREVGSLVDEAFAVTPP
jgi:adenine-specific DNA-methyltransferase